MPQLGRTRNRIRSHATYVVATFAAFVVSCHATSATPPTCSTKVNGFIGLKNCSPDYILCNHGEETKARCPEPLVFNNHRNVCVEENTCDPQEPAPVTNQPTSAPELDDDDEVAPPPYSEFNNTDRVPIENGYDRDLTHYRDYLELFFKPWFREGSICGGVALFEDWGITAAHCFEYEEYNPSFWEKWFYSIHDWFFVYAKVTSSGKGVKHKIDSVFIHEDYYKSNRTLADIAMFRVTTKFDDDDLADLHDGESPMTFTDCTHAALHSKENIKLGGVYQGGLAMNNLVMQDDMKCLKYKDTASKKTFYHVGKMLCAFPDDRRTGHQKGDSGSGVYCVMREASKTLVGLQSYRINDQKITPEFYTNVNYYRDWIDKIVRENKRH